MTTAAPQSSSVMFPSPQGDFKTQLQNLTRAVAQLQKQNGNGNGGGQIVPNPNSTPTTDNTPGSKPTSPSGNTPTLDPIGDPLPIAPPILIAQGVRPITNLKVTPGAYLTDCYLDVSWTVVPDSNALAFDVLYGIVDEEPGQTMQSITLTGSQRVSGNAVRLHGLVPNTFYGVQVVASNVLGQSMVTPAVGYLVAETTSDATIPPPVSQNGAVVVGQGATSVIVTFQPLTFEQAPDVANGNGVYLVEITSDPTWAAVARQVYTSAWVVAFNDIFPHTVLQQDISVSNGPGTTVAFSDLSQVTPGLQFIVLIDNEYIVFNAPSGNSATISQRNAGISPLVTGAESHLFGAKVTFWSQTTWFARVAPIDASGNQGPWTNSSGTFAGGVSDAMLVGDFNAAHITFGLMTGDRIEVNSLSAQSLKTSTLSASTVTLGAGGQLFAGNPPGTGLALNSQGLTLYNNGNITVSLSAVTGEGIFSGTVDAATITGSIVTGSIIESATTAPRVILQSGPAVYDPFSGTSNGGVQFDAGSPNDNGYFAVIAGYTDRNGYTGMAFAPGGITPGVSMFMDTTGLNFGASTVTCGTITSTVDNPSMIDCGGGYFSIATPDDFFGSELCGGPVGFYNNRTIAQTATLGWANLGAPSNGISVTTTALARTTFLPIAALQFITSSSRHLKKNIKSLELESEIIHSLRPVSFEYKNTPGARFGFIAEEVKELNPDLIAEVRTPDGDPDHYGIDYGVFVPLLVAEVQKLKERIDALNIGS